MQNLFEEVASLDARCYSEYGLSEDILMEHAADGMADHIRKNHALNSSVLIICGAGNNGADGMVLARLLHRDYDVHVLLPYGAKSQMALLQLRRLEAIEARFTTDTDRAYDVVVDALFGSGFNREFDVKMQKLLKRMNDLSAVKIACDIPTGVHLDGSVEVGSFVADITLSMGALKRGMFSDEAKGYVGEIEVIDLGVSRQLYERSSNWKLLEAKDLTLPHRHVQNTHKGSYGHLGVICGEKSGAAVMSGLSALRFGAGLVTLLSNTQEQIPHALMQLHLLPETTTAIALGMGLGTEFSNEELLSLLDNAYPLLLDADIFAHGLFLTLLSRKNIVITPHPKEFTTILKVCGLADISVATLQKERFKFVEQFSQAYPDVTLLLKGANVIIVQNNSFFVNPLGSNILAKGGSGDVLAGLIASLLAQGSSPLEAAIQGSLAHTKAASSLTLNSYAMTPDDLIAAVAHL